MNQTAYSNSGREKSLGLFLVVLLNLIPLSVNAGALGELDVRSAVQTWVRGVTADARPDAFIERMEPFIVEGGTAAYIAHLSGGGFCLCGADESVLPVYFYSPWGTYDPGNPGCQDILEEIASRTKYLKEGMGGDILATAHQQAISERVQYWRELVSGNVSKRGDHVQGALAEPDSMSLPLTSRWGQGSPYNDQCPQLTPGADEHTIVGCTATAISQVMYYWQWPNTGVGTHTGSEYDYRWRSTWDEEPLSVDPNVPSTAFWATRLRWTSASGGRLQINGYWEAGTYTNAQSISTNTAYLAALATLYGRLTQATTTNSANFGATTYRWDLIRDVHTDPPDAPDAAVATLCFQVAVALDTEFGLGWSGSDLWRAVDPSNNRKPLVNNFLYDADAYYGHANISALVTEEIQWLRPVAFSGSGSIGGHAWILYGYNKGTDPNRQFKMNMGWYGGSDGWYSLDNVPLSLTQNHGYLIYVAPQDVVGFIGNTASGDGSPLEPYIDITQAVSTASSGTTLIFKAGSDNTFTAPLTITKALTLKGRDVTIRKK
jgi:hypothetical protein